MNFIWLAPAVITALAYIPKRNKKDFQVVNEILKNRNVGIRKKGGTDLIYPKLIKKHENPLYKTLIYKLPLGLPSDVFNELKSEIVEGLNREIESEYEDGVVKLRIFNKPLTTRWNFDKKLLKPNTWKVPIACTHSELIYHDFEKYPHLLTGGVTRFGKTVFLKVILNSLILNNFDDVDVYILDLKGGLEFYKYKQQGLVKEVACDLYESANLLGMLTADLKQKELYFRDKGYTNIVETPIRKRTFVFVDEGAELSPAIIKDYKDKKIAEYCQACLSEIARIGGAVGYRLIYATQYPTKEAVPMQVKMNIVARMSFVCASEVASRVVLDNVAGTEIPSIPGRGIYQIDKPKMVQVAYINDETFAKVFNSNFSANADEVEKTDTGEEDKGLIINEMKIK